MILTRKSKEASNQWHERNVLIEDFFKNIGMHVTLIGDANNPAVVLKRKLLSCYVHNYTLHFTTRFDRGQDIYKCRVDNLSPDIDLLTKWFQTASQDKAFMIKVNGCELYVCGISITSGKPVFGSEDSGVHYYNTQEFAEHIIKRFSLKDFCKVV